MNIFHQPADFVWQGIMIAQERKRKKKKKKVLLRKQEVADMMNECEHWKHFLFGNIEIMLSFRDRTCIWSISIYLEEYIYWYRFNHGGHQGRTRVVFRVQKKRFTCRRRYWTAIGKNDIFFWVTRPPLPLHFPSTKQFQGHTVHEEKKYSNNKKKNTDLTKQNSSSNSYMAKFSKHSIFFFFFNISVLIKCQVCIFMKNVINCFS